MKCFEEKMSYPQFLKYLVPSVLTMIFLSFYTTIDGFFVSRYAGSDALAGINIVIPITCIIFGTAPKNITNAYGITCSIKRSLLPKKIQIGFKNRIPPIVNTRESMSSTIAIKVKISFASCSRFCP